MYQKIRKLWEANNEWTPKSYWLATVMLIATCGLIYNQSGDSELRDILLISGVAVVWTIQGFIVCKWSGNKTKGVR